MRDSKAVDHSKVPLSATTITEQPESGSGSKARPQTSKNTKGRKLLAATLAYQPNKSRLDLRGRRMLDSSKQDIRHNSTTTLVTQIGPVTNHDRRTEAIGGTYSSPSAYFQRTLTSQ